MAVNVSAWSIRHPIPPIVIALAIAAVGYLSLIKLPITRYPNVDVPLVTVLVTQFGASPGGLRNSGDEEDRGCSC